MDALTITVLILALLALGSWGYGSYAVRPVAGAEVVPAGPAPAPWLSLLGVVGLILLVAFIVMLVTGWRFGLTIAPPP